MNLDRESKVYVAGHRGLVGSAITRALKARGYTNVVGRTHQELDLTDTAAVNEFFEVEKPDAVYLAAAKVGGIVANSTYPAEFIQTNLEIQSNVLKAAWRGEVKRLLFLGSSCIYPRDCPQPIREEYLMTGPLEETNSAYATAKIAGIEMCRAYNAQYGTRFLAAMPTNLYGPSDNYDLETSHVLPALIRKMHEAKVNGSPQVEVWGTGTPKREFLWSDDLAEASLFLMELSPERFDDALQGSAPALVNIGCGVDVSIKELANLIKEVTECPAEVTWNRSKPDGTPRKLLDVEKLTRLGWTYRTNLKTGIERAYANYLETYA